MRCLKGVEERRYRQEDPAYRIPWQAGAYDGAGGGRPELESGEPDCEQQVRRPDPPERHLHHDGRQHQYAEQPE
jgi:hypothetical protein